MASKELQIALRLLAQTSEFDAAIVRSKGNVFGLGDSATQAGGKAAAGFARAEAGANRLDKALSSARNQLIAFAAGFASIQGVRSLIDVADSAQNMTARLKLATDSSAELAQAQAEVFRISQSTSVSLSETTNLYARLSGALKDTGASQADVTNLTETINQALAVSGTSAGEAAGAIQQLSQGLAAGALRGDEFNSVNEGGGRIMIALAEALGKTRGELRGLAEDGALTTEVIQAALSEQSDEIAREAAQLPLTFERAATQFGNSFSLFIGRLDQSTGASASLALAVQSLAVDFQNGTGVVATLSDALTLLIENAGLIASTFVTGTKIAAAYLLVFKAAPAAYAVASAGLVAYKNYLISTSIATELGIKTALTFQTVVAGAAQAAFVAFAAYNVGELLFEQFQAVRDAGAYLVFGLAQAWENLKFTTKTAFFAVADSVVRALALIREQIANTLDAFVELAQFDLGSIGGVDLRADFTFTAGDNIKAIAQSLRDASNASQGFGDELSALQAEYDRNSSANAEFLESQLAANASFDSGAKSAKQLAEAESELGNASGKTAKELLAEALANGKATDGKKSAAKATREQKEALEAFAEAQKQSQQGAEDLAQINERLTREIEDQAAQMAGPAAQAQLAYERNMQAIEASWEALAAIGPPTREAFAALDAAIASANERLNQELVTIETGAEKASKAYTQYWRDAFSDVTDTFADGFATALVDGTDDAAEQVKGNLDRITKTIISDLVRQFINANIVIPIQAQLTGVQGAPGSGLLGGLGQLFGGGQSGLTGGSIFDRIGSVISGTTGGILQNIGGFFSQGGAFQSGILSGLGNFGSGLAAAGANISGSGVFGSLFSNISQGIGSLFSGGVGAGLGQLFGSVVPVLGPLIAIGSAIKDRFSSKPTGNTGTQFQFGGDAFSGFNTTEVQRRGILGIGRSKPRNRRSDLTDDQFDAGNEVQEAAAAAGRAAALAAGRTFVGVVAGEFSRTVSRDGKVEEIGRVLGATYKAPLEEFARVLAAETAIRQLPEVASQIAQAYRGSVEGIVDASQFLVTAQAAIKDNLGLFDGADALQNTADAVERLQGEGESLTEAFVRISAATNLLESALDLSGTSSRLARDAFIDFAAGITDASGGLEQSAALWERYFEVAFSADERAQSALRAAESRRDNLLGQADLGANTTLADVRRAIEDLLRTGGDPQRVVLLLNLADAIADVSEAAGDAGPDLEALTDAMAGLADFSRDLDDRFRDLERSGLSEFDRGLLGVNDQLLEDVALLQRTRREMVARGATTEQLANIDRELARAHAFAAQSAIRAIQQLQAQGRSLVSQLRGRAAEQAAQSFADAGTQAFQDIGEAAQGAFESALAAFQSLADYLDGQLLSENSSLTPDERFAAAQAQFNAALANANINDPESIRRLTQLADQLIREGRSFDPSDFPELERDIRAALQALLAGGPPVQTGGGASVGGGGGSTGTGGSGGDVGDDFAASQAQLALQIAEVIRQLIGATQDSLSDVAASIGIEVAELVDALGVSLTDLTAGSVQSLGQLANSLGIELTDLADEVGVQLGSLADAQSLLNDALEAEIARLPAGQRDLLQPLLDAVEAAADDPVGLARAEAALSDAIADIGGQAAAQLAPYLDAIDPIDPLRSIDSGLRSGFGDVVSAVGVVADLIGRLAPEGSFAIGTPFVAKDMIANIHAGEAVIDADSMQVLRRYGIRVAPLQTATNTSSALSPDELRQIRFAIERMDKNNLAATADAALHAANSYQRAAQRDRRLAMS